MPTVFLELHSRKSVRFPEQIMSEDKYPGIFSHQMETIVHISRSLLNVFAHIFTYLSIFVFTAFNGHINEAANVQSLERCLPDIRSGIEAVVFTCFQ